MALAAPPRTEALVWNAQPKQETFLLDYADVFEVLYGGAAGGGKSDALLIFQIIRRMQYPLSSGLFLRRHFTELLLQDGAIPRSHELLSGRAAWNGSDYTWTFPNRSVLQFGHMNTEEAKYRYQSSGYEDMCFDEVTHFFETMYLYMWSRCRTTIPDCQPKIRPATNPGNVGHGWVKARFIDSQVPFSIGHYKRIRDEHGSREVACGPDDPKGRSRAFVPAKLEDNAFLYREGRGEYEATLEALPDDDYRALRLGDWDAWQGQVFKRWRRERHVVEPFAIPADCPRSAGLDWGYESPFVCLWTAWGRRLVTDPPAADRCDHVHSYTYRELTMRRALDAEHARECARLSAGEHVDAWNADPSSFFAHVDRTGPIPADVWRSEAGIVLLPSNNERIQGKRAVDAALADCACGVPRARFFSTCLETIRTLPMLTYDPLHVEDVLKGPDDHHFDAWRYDLMGRRPQRASASAERATVAVSGMHA